ncbi:53211565-8a32-491b-aebf-ef3f151a1dd8 [Thermothielavioides terrestris]|uniref:53211565-8a32-491b-aebf-ef3f151a1dd8 n=1 Tax=Thermothielavioides terrestris TaxID=2587410 RepID=A0A446BSI9_9PEZI|nr:53211565-8a32-491b-aebf-ef3f151a1dd8 [Thermothielavioides terrestris]
MALRYYGAARLCTTIEICVPTEKLADADALISKGTDNASYTAWRGHQPDLEVHRCSLYHTFPRYRLNHEGPEFDFYLVPSEDWRLDCVPENFEYSAQQQIPYPKLHLFAQSLLERQEINDLQDLVDGMDITEEWGEQNLRLDSPGKEYAQWVAAKNAKIRAALPQRIRDDPLNQICGPGMYDMDEEFVAFRDVLAHIVRTKEPRARLQFPCGTYATKYRAKGSPDPRTTIRFHV